MIDLRWEQLFGNENPVELEVGTGKGAFLMRRARAHPDRNFLGIEWANEFYRFAADRMDRWKISNVRMLRTDAAAFLRQYCPQNSLSVVHVYHPDPWPKKRHHKRRFFQRANIDTVVRCLVRGGRLAVQTDHAEYFSIIRAELFSTPELEEVPFDDARFGVVNASLGTNFEIKYLREGRAIFRIAMERR